ncbi:MAG TPA: acyltransferase family protein, partial [Pseudonocardiaceae bacterium]|nr:acyltransferase family protein [Pseudonocardiaceae bacterium]
MNGRHSAALDSLRGLALLGVVFFHAGALPFGWLGVPVFFVLSGHFITRILFEHGTSLRSFVRN